jgi:hypothetical protein
MKYQSLDQIRAEVLPHWLSAGPMSRADRLERWAAALEREGIRELNTLYQIEYMPRARRRALREDDSLLTVAFNDPYLRAEGLAGDTVGDVMTFFRVSDRELHDIACYCHRGPKMSAQFAAARVRALAARPTVDRRPMIVGACIAASLVLGMLLI